jgi:two-component system CheB/CheR fusion protein
MSTSIELIRILQRLYFCRDLDSVTMILRDAARDLTDADGVTVVLREGDDCYYAQENAIAPLWRGRRFPIRSCISGWCMLHREKVAIPDIYADSRVPHDAYRPTFVKSLAMVPIRSEEPIGAIGAYWASNHEATEAELEVLQCLGDSASLAIANGKLIEDLEQANRRKDEFLAMLGHELRNPLAPMLSALHAIGLKADDREIVHRMREIMERQVRHMSKILDGLLDVSRLSSGRLTLKCERLDFTHLVDQATADRRAVIEDAGVMFHIELPDTPIWVLGDHTRLVQAITNVLDNAAKFTPEGGKVVVRLMSEKETAVLSISDNGIGIDAETLPGVFDVFTQGDRSLSRARGGLGLGLAITKNVLDLHCGGIEAISAGIGTGAEFILRVPCEAELPALSGEMIASNDAAVARLQVLIVEDNPDAAHALRMLLELCGYDVSLARTGAEGLAVAKAKRPQVVLCDIGLPGMDGYQVATALRQDPQTAETRLIAVTAYGMEEDRRRALAAGFDVHLVKPVDCDKLLQHLSPA